MDSLKTPLRRAPGDPSSGVGSSSNLSATAFQTPVRFQQHKSDFNSVAAATPLARSPLPAAQQPDGSASTRGKWFSPEAQRVLDDQAAHLSERQSTMRLRWNVASLVVLAWLSHTGVYRQLKSVGTSLAIVPMYVWTAAEWLSVAVLAYNIGEAVWYLLQPKNQYAGISMTPTQRLRMGLDSRVASTSKDKPAAPPCMTPKKVALAASQTPSVSVTDLESRRKTPIKAAVTVATPSRTGAGNDAGTDSMAAAAATPRTLRSPAALSSSQAHADYSTASDFLTLMKVLKTVPGTSNVTDAEPQATPSLSRSGFGFPLSSNLPLSSGFGDSTMVTPRLPVSRYGLNDITAATPLQQHLRSQPTVGLYQTATPVSRKSGSEGSKGASKDRSSGDIEYLEPHEVLEKYGIERDMFDWVENMRSWFVRHLLRPLCKQIDELDELFQQNGLGHLSCRKAVLDAQALEQAKNASTVAPGGLFGSRLGTTSVLGGTFGSGFGSSAINPISTQANQSQSNVPQTLVDLSLRYGDLPQTKERMALEKYLLVPGFDNSREYIVQRVHTLAQSGALPGYVFDGGASYIADAEPGTTTAAGSGVGSGASHSGLPSSRERPWNQAQHPTDGQLLFHLFCAFMDQVMPPVQNIRHAFTDRYVLQPDRKPNYNLPAQIIQVVRKRPHFCLVVKGSFYDVSAGRNNLFVTLILFVLEIQRECAGYLGLTNLGGKHVDLLSVLKNKSAFGT